MRPPVNSNNSPMTGRRVTGSPPTTLLVAVLLATACSSPGEEGSAASASNPPQQSPAELTATGGEAYHGLLPYRARDAKLALVEPSFVTADAAQLVDGVSVVGVSVDGAHRAYPLYVLKNHQVVNDRLGDVPIAASW